MTTLFGDGWRGEFGGTTPVQGLGEVDGRPFYFRARWEEWSLSVAEEGKDPLDVFPYGEGGFHHEEEWPGGPFEAGWMELADVQKCMEKGVALFRGAMREQPATCEERVCTCGHSQARHGPSHNPWCADCSGCEIFREMRK